MSVELRKRPSEWPSYIQRPAPDGTLGVAGPKSPPDGWRLEDATAWERGVTALDRRLLRASARVSTITRRRFIRRAASAGAALGLAGARLLGPQRDALAIQGLPCNACVNGATDNNPGACGPSEPCDVQECDGAGRCETSHECANGIKVRGRIYNTQSCPAQNDPQAGYWDECCGGVGTLHRCTDCCGCRSHSSGRCDASSCPGDPHYKCICELNLELACDVGPDTC